MMKYTFLLILGCIFSFSALSQKIYIADTAFVTDNGFGGAPASCLCNGCSWAGQNMDYDYGWWLADDITVPAGVTYKIDTLVIYGYERNSPITSTFNAAYLQIYSGDPSAGGTLVWGDTSTNRLAHTAFTGMYRIPSSYPNDASRPLMSLNLSLSPAPILSSGTYWLVWSARGSGAHWVDGSFKVLRGRINPPAQNGLEHHDNIWEQCHEDGAYYGFNFIVIGRQTTGISELSNPTIFSLQNAPNPVTESTTISFELTESTYSKLTVYNAVGQCIATLMDGIIEAGKHEVIFNGDQFPGGIYYYQLSSPSGTATKQMPLTR